MSELDLSSGVQSWPLLDKPPFRASLTYPAASNLGRHLVSSRGRQRAILLALENDFNLPNSLPTIRQATM